MKIAVLVGAILCTQITASDLLACSCIARSVEEQLREATKVFRGRIASSQVLHDPPCDADGVSTGVEFAIDVREVWSGEVFAQDILSTSTLTTCGRGDLPIGEDLIFVLGTRGEDLTISSCDGVLAADQRDVVVAELGEAHNPHGGTQEPRDCAEGCSQAGASGGLLALFAIVVIRLRNRAKAGTPQTSMLPS